MQNAIRLRARSGGGGGSGRFNCASHGPFPERNVPCPHTIALSCHVSSARMYRDICSTMHLSCTVRVDWRTRHKAMRRCLPWNPRTPTRRTRARVFSVGELVLLAGDRGRAGPGGQFAGAHGDDCRLVRTATHTRSRLRGRSPVATLASHDHDPRSSFRHEGTD